MKKILLKLFHWLIIKKSPLFNASWYELTYGIPKRKAAGHYLNAGYLNKYIPSPLFDGNVYREVYPDTTGINPLVHYELYGKKEGRSTYAKKTLKDISSFAFSNSELFDGSEFIGGVHFLDGKIYGEELIKNSKRIVFLFSHEMSLTGAPIALERLAKILKEEGYDPIVVSFEDGPLSLNTYKKEIPVVILDWCYTDYFEHFFRYAEFNVVCTITSYSVKVIDMLNDSLNKTVWWVHESRQSYSSGLANILPKHLSSNIHVFCVGAYAKKVLTEIKPDYDPGSLLYCLNRSKDIVKKDRNDDKKVLAIIGSLINRKGHSVLFEALRSLDQSILDKIELKVAGSACDQGIADDMKKLINKKPGLIDYLGLIDQDGINELYSQIDCLICPSLDDPMPIVVSEAMQHEIPFICSENIGQYEFVEKYNCGIAYHNNDSKELAEAISAFVNNKYDLGKMTEHAKKVYESIFTEDVFRENIRKIIKELDDKEIIDDLIL